MTNSRKPDFLVYTVKGHGDKSYFTKIGAAWMQNHSNGYNIVLDALPIGDRLILCEPKDGEPKDA